MDDAYLVLPPGSSARVRDLLQHYKLLRKELERLRADGVKVRMPSAYDPSFDADARARRLEEVNALLRSGSWRAAAPLRWLGALVRGRSAAEPVEYRDLSTDELDDLVRQIRTSISWRLTAPLRYLSGLRRRRQPL
jgi:hypothetical protein